MKIIFIDRNKSLVSKVKKAIKFLPKEWNVSAKCGDIFEEEGVIVSASNPNFTMSGGLDALIAEKYPKECVDIDRKDGNQRHGNVIFTITVGEDLKATRELVAEALKSALYNTENGETVLISGLGTGIGGLDPDDIVWLFLAALCEHFGYGWGIKFTKKDGSDFRTGKIFYEVGKMLEQNDAEKDGADCGVGLHLGKSFIGAGNYAVPEKVFFCMYSEDDFCGESNDKVRISKLKVLAELPLWLGFGTKKIHENMTKNFDPEDYNPYQATKLPTLKTIKDKIKEPLKLFGDQVWAQAGYQVGSQVRAQVWAQVGSQVWAQVGDQVWAQDGYQVGDQVVAQVRAQVGDQVWAQVGDQVWAQAGYQVGDQVGAQVDTTSFWAVNIHFELGVSHWFGDFLSLGIMPIFVNGKMKVFGKKGKYLGEYDMSEFEKE